MPSPDPNDEAAAALWQQLTRWSGNRTRSDLMVDIGLGRKIASIVAKRLAQVIGERGGVRPDAVTLSRRHFAAGRRGAGGQSGPGQRRRQRRRLDPVGPLLPADSRRRHRGLPRPR